MTFFLASSMDDYKNRQHPKINGVRTTRNKNDAENEERAKYILSQHFNLKIKVFSDDSHCKIDFAGIDKNGQTVALFEFKKRGNNHNDYRYKKGYWVPCKKFDELVRYGIHERKSQNQPYILNLFYCWGFNDAFLYINTQAARVWLMDVVEGGLGYHVKEKLNGGKENVYLVPLNNRHIKSISPVGITMPWLHGETFYPWL